MNDRDGHLQSWKYKADGLQQSPAKHDFSLRNVTMFAFLVTVAS